MEIISMELTKEECTEFRAKVSAVNNMYCELLEELKHKNIFKAHCANCGASFIYSYSDVTRWRDEQVFCPVCGKDITVSSDVINSKYNELETMAKNDEHYVKLKAELTEFANKHNIYVHFMA